VAVPIDGVSVVIANAIVEAHFPGGIAAYERESPNGTYCSDGQICRVAFMVEADAKAFAERLTGYGFSSPWSGEISEMALVAQSAYCLHPRDWLEVDLRTIVTADGRQSGATIAWLRGETPAMVAAPAGWTPGAMQIVSVADLQNSYEFVEAKSGDGGRVETYRHRETGQALHIGRPQVTTAASVQAPFMELWNELKDLEDRPLRAGRQQALASFFERTAQLVKDTHAREPGRLLLHGIAARFVKQWELAAESARAVTVLRPDLIEGWLDLTWALAELGRLDEAESCAHEAVALDTTHAPALGNLASVLLHRGKVEEAFVTITSALQSDPANSRNQLIRERIREARDQVIPETHAPWYRKLWRPR
jgi:Flp pilus assembly protein TadD